MFFVLRVFSWLFQAVLSLAAIAVATAALVTSSDLVIPWLPIHGTNQSLFLLGIGIVGLICVVLAVRGTWRILLFLFSIHTLYMLVKGMFLSSFSFSGPTEFRNGVILAICAFFALIGAWPSSSKRR